MTALLVENAREVVTCAPAGRGDGVLRRVTDADLAIVRGGSVLLEDGVITAVGTRDEVAPAAVRAARGGDVTRIDAADCVVTPGFVDAHTHLVFVGSREDEYAMRIAGRTYQEIAAAGGGIHSSVRRFRETPMDALLRESSARLARCLAHGTTTAEVKSGYGLSLEEELKALEAIRKLQTMQPVDLVPTFLGAHEVPLEFREDREAYMRLLMNDMIPIVSERRLACFCDVFCEKGVFEIDESERILESGKARGLAPKLHADEFYPLGGAELAARVRAISADHLLRITDEGIAALAASDTIAVLCPGASFGLGAPFAPARKIADAGCAIALGTDLNPGSSMCESMQAIISFACSLLRLSPAEAIVAATRNAAFAVGRGADIGRLAPGFRGDLLLLDIPSHNALPYHYGVNHVLVAVKRGEVVHRAAPPQS
ncbi:MAG: imidazolonepropionase [bacterium]